MFQQKLEEHAVEFNGHARHFNGGGLQKPENGYGSFILWLFFFKIGLGLIKVCLILWMINTKWF